LYAAPNLPDAAARLVGHDRPDPATVTWTHGAIVAEDGAARREGARLQRPAHPAFAPDKEIKNVAAAAQTKQYWAKHAAAHTR